MGKAIQFTCIALSALAGAACGSPTTSADPHTIYAAALQSVLVLATDTTPIVLERWTQLPEYLEADHYFSAIGAPGSLIRAHRSLNEKSIELDSTLAQTLNIHLWTPDSLSNPSALLGTWTSAYSSYGSKVYVIVVSQPVVSRDGTTALVHYWLGCGPLCGEGHVVKLERLDRDWRIIADSMYIVS